MDATWDASADVVITDVVKSFGPLKVLDGITMTMPAGQTTCLIGASGSGKSTLLRCLNGLDRVDSGSIQVGGRYVTDPRADLNHIRGNVGMVFQHFNLFPHLDALANVTLALRKVRRMPAGQAEQIALRCLSDVGMAGWAHKRPGTLSGGQQQRVAIARALAMDPKVMLFDEVTSALDPELVKGVLGLMRDLSHRSITMIVVTHEMRYAREVAGQVAFIDAGHVAEYGPPDQIFDNPRTPRLKRFLSQVL